jgi:hypothetical protein
MKTVQNQSCLRLLQFSSCVFFQFLAAAYTAVLTDGFGQKIERALESLEYTRTAETADSGSGWRR